MIKSMKQLRIFFGREERNQKKSGKETKRNQDLFIFFLFTKYASLPYYPNSDSRHLISGISLQQSRQRSLHVFMFLIWPVDGEKVPEHCAASELIPGRVFLN